MFSKNILFIVLLSSFACTMMQALDACPLSKDGKKQCYCAFACGPREIKPEQGDKPFMDADKGIYFCQQRDQDHFYQKGGCPAKNWCTAPEEDRPVVIKKYLGRKSHTSKKSRIARAI